jgi:hypothetical protein
MAPVEMTTMTAMFEAPLILSKAWNKSVNDERKSSMENIHERRDRPRNLSLEKVQKGCESLASLWLVNLADTMMNITCFRRRILDRFKYARRQSTRPLHSLSIYCKKPYAEHGRQGYNIVYTQFRTGQIFFLLQLIIFPWERERHIYHNWEGKSLLMHFV